MKLRRILRACVVLPDHPTMWPKILGTGSVVEVLPPKDSPVTGRPDEVYVHWTDATQTLYRGWLAKYTPMSEQLNMLHINYEPAGSDDNFSTWDELRRRMYYPRRFKQPMAKDWLFRRGRFHLPELRRVIREFGGIQRPNDEAPQLIRHLVRLLFNENLKRVPSMNVHTHDPSLYGKEAVMKAVKAAKKAAKKGGSKKDLIVLPTSKKEKTMKKTAKKGNGKSKLTKKGTPSKQGGKGEKRPSFKGMKIVTIGNLEKISKSSGGKFSLGLLAKHKKGIRYEDYNKQGGKRKYIARGLKKKILKLVEGK